MANIAVVFPGQGSQSVGMLNDLAPHYPEIKQTFNIASSVLGYDLWQLIAQGPADQLNQTVYTQPALLTASYAIWQILLARTQLAPTWLAGHSLGEYTALVCSEALSFPVAVKLVAARGQYMQEAVAQDIGAMGAIIGLPDDVIVEICAVNCFAGEVLSPANFNSIGQTVIAGHKVAVQRALQAAKVAGAKLTILLPISVPSHCSLMAPAALALAKQLQDIAFQTPKIPVLNNHAVTVYQSADAIVRGLTQQLVSPVRWVETIEKLTQEGVDTVIECGPGKILTGLNKRINQSLCLLTTTNSDAIGEVIKRNEESNVK